MTQQAHLLAPLHGFLASRRARRLNLRPPGEGAKPHPFHPTHIQEDQK